MNECIAPWVDIGLKVVTAAAATTVAAYVARISCLQWKNNQEKLRLDLYERRFAIYMHVLDFHRELLRWGDTEDQKSLEQPFTRAVRESKFLFPESSGVYEFLEEFSSHAFYITNFRSALGAWGPSPKSNLSGRKISLPIRIGC
jgi:hypothetical protein